jgi:cation diffusion facilitator family transporter
MHDGSHKAIAAAFFANLGIAIAKFVAFIFTGAASMLAEAIHSVADTGNQALLFMGGKRARRAPTAAHPFGYGRERYFWSFVVALVLFSLGSLFAIYEGIQKLIDPHELDEPIWAFVVLGIAIVLECFSLRTAVVETRKVKRADQTWWRFIRTAKVPELPVVLLEDVGALTGLLFALGGVTAATITDDPLWDATGSIAIGVLLGIIAVILAIEMKSLLIGEAAAPEVEVEIRAAIAEGDDVRHLIHLRTEHLGPDDVLVAAKVDLGERSSRDLAKCIDDLEARVRARVPSARVIYIEPDLFDRDHTRVEDSD